MGLCLEALMGKRLIDFGGHFISTSHRKLSVSSVRTQMGLDAWNCKHGHSLDQLGLGGWTVALYMVTTCVCTLYYDYVLQVIQDRQDQVYICIIMMIILHDMQAYTGPHYTHVFMCDGIKPDSSLNNRKSTYETIDFCPEKISPFILDGRKCTIMGHWCCVG